MPPPVSLSSLHAASLRLPFCPPHFTPLRATSLHLLFCLPRFMPLSFRGTSRFVSLTSRHFTSPLIWLVPLHATSPCLPFCPPHFTPFCPPHFTPLRVASLLSASPHATSCHFASPPVLSASLRATSLYFASPPFFQPHFNSPHLISPVRPPARLSARPPARPPASPQLLWQCFPPKKYGFFRKRPIKQKPQPVSPIPP